MIVKVGNKVYDSDLNVIGIYFTDTEKMLINKMGTASKFVIGPNSITEDDLRKMIVYLREHESTIKTQELVQRKKWPRGKLSR
jgi:hypothetical protein